MKISASLLSQSDMFIAMSNSGNTSELISAAEVAKSHGAYVVAITNFEGSKLTDCADLVLLTTDQSRNTDHQFINTQIATLFNRYCELSFIRKYKSESNLSTY